MKHKLNIMKIIKTSEELAGLVDENKDLRIDDDLLFEFSPRQGELRDVFCRDIILRKNGWFLDLNCRNFNGWNFNGRNFNGGDIIYCTFFCLNGGFINHGKITSLNPKAHPPIELVC